MKLGICLVLYVSNEKHLQYVLETQNSIHEAMKTTPKIDYEIIHIINYISKPEYYNQIVDHNLKDNYVGSWQIKSSENCLGLAWNLGFDQAVENNCDYILFPNTDIHLHKYCIRELVKFAQEKPEALLWSASELDDFDDLENKENFEADFATSPSFAFFMVKNDYKERLKSKDPDTKNPGKFPEYYKPAYFEDNDTHRRIVLAGFEALRTTTARFFHYGSKTINSDPVLQKSIVPFFENNRDIYIQRWGGLPGKEKYLTPYNK